MRKLVVEKGIEIEFNKNNDCIYFTIQEDLLFKKMTILEKVCWIYTIAILTILIIGYALN